MIPLFRGFWGQGIRYQGYFGDPRYNSHRKLYKISKKYQCWNYLTLKKKVIVLLIFIEFEQTKHQNDQNAPYKHAP